MGIGLAVVLAAAAGTSCTALDQKVLNGRICAATPGGLVLADTPARAAQLAQVATDGEARFRTRFARAVPRYAVVQQGGAGDAAALDAAPLDAELTAQGYVVRLPWLSPAAMAEGMRASVTRAAIAQAQAKGFDQATTDGIVAASLAQQAARLTPDALAQQEAGTLPHELGHGWFIRSYWPVAAVTKGDHYGGPAPDWMDEVAAVLMESDALAERRREQFARAYRGSDADARARLVLLDTFLSGGHPALPVLPSAAAPGSAPGGVRVLTGDEAAKVAAVAGGFYLQARLFADYVFARSGDPTVFAAAGRAFAGGMDTAGWLKAHGAAAKLPTTLSALQRDWEAWLATRFPATPAT